MVPRCSQPMRLRKYALWREWTMSLGHVEWLECDTPNNGGKIQLERLRAWKCHPWKRASCFFYLQRQAKALCDIPPALVESNKWASSPRSNWPGHVWDHEFWVPWLLEKEKFEIWSSRIRWLLSWPGQRCQETYSNNNKILFSQIWRQESKVSTSATTLIPGSPQPLTQTLGQVLMAGSPLQRALLCLMSSLGLCFFLKDTNCLRVVAHPNDLTSYRLHLYTVGNQGLVDGVRPWNSIAREHNTTAAGCLCCPHKDWVTDDHGLPHSPEPSHGSSGLDTCL